MIMDRSAPVRITADGYPSDPPWPKYQDGNRRKYRIRIIRTEWRTSTYLLRAEGIGRQHALSAVAEDDGRVWLVYHLIPIDIGSVADGNELDLWLTPRWPHRTVQKTRYDRLPSRVMCHTADGSALVHVMHGSRPISTVGQVKRAENIKVNRENREYMTNEQRANLGLPPMGEKHELTPYERKYLGKLY